MPDLTVVTPAPASRLETLVEDYLAHCRARGLSPKTIRDNYGYALKGVFLHWAAGQGITEPSQITNRLLDRFSADLLERGGKRGPLSRFSVASFVESVNWWLRWLRAEGELEAPAKAQVPRRPQRVLDVLSREEIQTIEDAAATERDKLIIRLRADTGIRVGELLGLRLTDLLERDRNHYLRVRGKGDKERLVPIPRLWRRLQRYVERGRPRDADSPHIFVSLRRDRRTGAHEPLTKSGVEQLVRVRAEQAGVPKRAYPHMLRHSYATWALNRGHEPDHAGPGPRTFVPGDDPAQLRPLDACRCPRDARQAAGGRLQAAHLVYPVVAGGEASAYT
jgi:site-specific recombinase XerD